MNWATLCSSSLASSIVLVRVSTEVLLVLAVLQMSGHQQCDLGFEIDGCGFRLDRDDGFLGSRGRGDGV